MERHTFAMRVKKGRMAEYRKRLGLLWPELTAFLDRNQVRNFSIWNVESILFGYCETADDRILSAKEETERQKLIEKMEDTFDWISEAGQPMRFMYQDFGVVRENKELIRHRVFIAKLKPGCEEEYKRRHDELAEKRGGAITQGPDSNFTIWCAGGYIFGYDEIDITMEQEPTEEEKAFTTEWETRQLEIMDWITNDVDWLTGEHHAASVRLAWHE